MAEKQKLEETSIKTQTIINTNNAMDKTNINLKLKLDFLGILSLSFNYSKKHILVYQP